MGGYNDYEYEGYENDDYYTVEDVLGRMETTECTPVITDIVIDPDTKKETEVYNCHSCCNVDCPYYYEVESI